MTTTESQVSDILRHPHDRKWTIQGFGMLRTYLDAGEVERLHIWDTDTAVPEVSVIHDHPWDFTSRIVWGSVVNQRYLLDVGPGEPVTVGRIKTGEGGGLLDLQPRPGLLMPCVPEMYLPGDQYLMEAPELHESIPARGTVSVISRRFHTARDDQFATVCWRSGDWVSAEPRPATRDEVEHFVALALYGATDDQR